MLFTASVDLSGFNQVAARTVETLQFGVRDAVRGAAQEGADEAKAVGRFKDRTGKLRAGIVAEFVRSSENSARWDIISKARYSRFVNDGTKPHVIVPVNAVALRFVVNGTVVFARKVNHPGSPAFNFMTPAYYKAERSLYRHLGDTVLKVQHLWE